MVYRTKFLSIFLISIMLFGFFVVLSVDVTHQEEQSIDSVYEVQLAEYVPVDFQTFNRDMNVTTFVSPDGSRDELWHFLNSATESIYVEIYGINHPHIIELIHELHATKPSLDMKFLIGWNSLGYYSPNDYVANNLTILGYPVKWTNNTDFNYAHQKFVIIDNETTIVHSGNWAKTSFPEYQYAANREWSIAMTDTAVTNFYLSVFEHDWNRGIDYDAGTHGTGTPLTEPSATSTYKHPFATAGTFSGVMKVTPIFSPDTALEGILWCITKSQYTLDIQIPYFTNWNDTGSVEQIIDAIIAAKERGVTVRVITEEAYDFEEVAHLFLEHGIPTVWQDERWFTANHNKGIIVDGYIVLVSSINYSDNSIENNREAGVIIEHEGVAQWFQEVYDFDWGMADADVIDDVNVYWTPNIPSSSDTTNVTVYTHRLYPDVTEVILSVKIGNGMWTNHTITSNVYPSEEGQSENYYYEIPPQPHGTNILVQAYVEAAGIWHKGVNMTIHVLNTVHDYVYIVEHPDMEYEQGDTGYFINWTTTALNPDSYIVFADEIEVVSDVWDGSGIDWAIDGLSVGSHNYTLFVNNTLGDSEVNTVWVNVLTSAVPIISGDIDKEIEIGATGFDIEWSVEDYTPETYEIFRNDTSQKAGAWNTSPSLFNISLDGLGLGVWNYTLHAEDGVGNSATDTVWVTVTDTVDPQIGPAPDTILAEYGETLPDITWTASDITLASFVVYVNHIIEDTGELVPTIDSVSYPIDGLPVGEYNITLVVFDAAGNSNSRETIATIVDTTDPTVSSPEDMMVVADSSGDFINWTGTDLLPFNYTIYKDGVEVKSGLWNSSSETISFELVALAMGQYSYRIVLFDTSGNSISDVVVVDVAGRTSTVPITSTTTIPTTSSTTDTNTTTTTTTETDQEPLTTEQIILIAAGVIVVLIGLVCGTKKKR